MTTTQQAIDALRPLVAEVLAIDGDHSLTIHQPGNRNPRAFLDADDLARILEAAEAGLKAGDLRDQFDDLDTENMRLERELTEERALRIAYRQEVDFLRPVVDRLTGKAQPPGWLTILAAAGAASAASKAQTTTTDEGAPDGK